MYEYRRVSCVIAVIVLVTVLVRVILAGSSQTNVHSHSMPPGVRLIVLACVLFFHFFLQEPATCVYEMELMTPLACTPEAAMRARKELEDMGFSAGAEHQ